MKNKFNKQPNWVEAFNNQTTEEDLRKRLDKAIKVVRRLELEIGAKSQPEEKQESQEVLWEYFTETLNKYVTKPMHPLAIKALQKHFTITRK